MSKCKQYTPKKRGAIVALFELGLSYAQIASRLKISRSGVGKICKKYQDSGSVDVGRRCGRPRCTSVRDDSMIRRCAKVNPFTTTTEIKTLNPNIRASCRTIRRRLSVEFGLKSRVAARKPLLTPKQCQKRLQFCKKFKNWTVDKWKNVIFSDESSFLQFGTYKKRVWRPALSRCKTKYTVGTVKYPPKQMIWGCMSASGRGSIHFIPPNETVTGAKYLDILRDHLKLSMRISRTTIFQQDGAPAHTAKDVTKWFKDNGIKVLEWPGNSPDLNPIENLWEIMKRQLRAKNPTSLQDMRFWLMTIWCKEVSQELCARLVESMPRRIMAVIKNKGQASKY